MWHRQFEALRIPTTEGVLNTSLIRQWTGDTEELARASSCVEPSSHERVLIGVEVPGAETPSHAIHVLRSMDLDPPTPLDCIWLAIRSYVHLTHSMTFYCGEVGRPSIRLSVMNRDGRATVRDVRYSADDPLRPDVEDLFVGILRPTR